MVVSQQHVVQCWTIIETFSWHSSSNFAAPITIQNFTIRILETAGGSVSLEQMSVSANARTNFWHKGNLLLFLFFGLSCGVDACRYGI